MGIPVPARESGCLKLLEVTLLMAHVVLDEEAERDGRIVADHATCREAFFGNSIHSGHQNLVLRLPPAQQRVPRLVAVAVRNDPIILRVPRTGIPAVDRSADKALAVV